EQASEKDEEKILEFLFAQFGLSEPISKSIKLTKGDAIELFCDNAKQGSNKYSTLAYDGDRLVGLCLCSLKDSDTEDTLVPAEVDFENHDCAEDIKKGPYKEHKANEIVTLVHALEDSLKRLIGKHKKVLKIDILSKGLGKALTRRAVEIALTERCDWVVTTATSSASQRIFAKAGLRVIYEIPYEHFRENGNPVFQNLYDGCSAGRAMAVNLFVCNIMQISLNTDDIYQHDGTANAIEFARKVAADYDARDIFEPFAIIDLDVVKKQLDLWKFALPSVKPYYAVKCNPDLNILKTLSANGACFDCASITEMHQILSNNLAASNEIILAHAIKSRQCIQYAIKNGITM
ncbi:unnamed protein product, partial [Strongylus vulgaris]